MFEEKVNIKKKLLKKKSVDKNSTNKNNDVILLPNITK